MTKQFTNVYQELIIVHIFIVELNIVIVSFKKQSICHFLKKKKLVLSKMYMHLNKYI
jgi:hypothetical protein